MRRIRNTPHGSPFPVWPSGGPEITHAPHPADRAPKSGRSPERLPDRKSHRQLPRKEPDASRTPEPLPHGSSTSRGRKQKGPPGVPDKPACIPPAAPKTRFPGSNIFPNSTTSGGHGARTRNRYRQLISNQPANHSLTLPVPAHPIRSPDRQNWFSRQFNHFRLFLKCGMARGRRRFDPVCPNPRQDALSRGLLPRPLITAR